MGQFLLGAAVFGMGILIGAAIQKSAYDAVLKDKG